MNQVGLHTTKLTKLVEALSCCEDVAVGGVEVAE